MTGPRAPAHARLLACVALALPACMVQMAAKTDRTFDPALRDSADIHVALYADDGLTEQLVRETLEKVPHVRIDPIDPEGRARFVDSCSASALGGDDGVLETWARDHGDTIVVTARLKVSRAGTRVCTSFRFTREGGECLEEHVEGETATAEIGVVARIEHEKRQEVRWQARPALRGFGEGFGPYAVDDARGAALLTLPLEGMQTLFTPQLTVGTQSLLPADGSVPDHGVFAVFRDGKRAMTVEVTGAGTPTEQTTPLYCCFEPRPGDTLVYRGPQLLLELLPTAALTRLSLDGDARPAGLFGLDLRVRNLQRGLRGGVRYEYAVARDVRVDLGTFELGYGFRPSPSWALGLLAGVGGGRAARTGAGDVHASGGHVEALLRATWEAHRWVYLNLDVGLIQSFGYGTWKDDAGAVPGQPLRLSGPMLRLAAEIR